MWLTLSCPNLRVFTMPEHTVTCYEATLQATLQPFSPLLRQCNQRWCEQLKVRWRVCVPVCSKTWGCCGGWSLPDGCYFGWMCVNLGSPGNQSFFSEGCEVGVCVRVALEEMCV